jgi:hypothetical protein
VGIWNRHTYATYAPAGQVICNRCHSNIPGSKLPDGGMTAGCYVVTGTGGWAEYAKPGEQFVCDGCMWADPAYQAVYGVHSNAYQAGSCTA